MRLRLAVDGKERDVMVEGDPPDVRVTVDGRTVPVRVRVDGITATADIDGKTISLHFGGGVRVDGISRSVHVEWAAEEALHEGSEQVVDVRPPMPGRIVRVLATPGESVRRGAPLVILEAMKMQNEIPAPVGGVVREVRVREGDAVAATDVLVRLGREARGKG